jgi:hypothetical protein
MKAIWAANDAVNGTPVKEPAAKKYREPTLVDLNNGPIDCEVRDYHDEPWKSGVLVCVHNSRAWRFQAQPQTRSYVYAPHWNQCRIAVPVEPIAEPAIKESLTTEPNPSEIPNSSSDPINPSHYRQGGIDCIEAIKAALGDGFIGYVWGNVLKYLWRWPKKGGVEDLKKARWYLDRLISEVGE